ncbi:two-component system, OmpR family, response regulator VicR [Tissierella praeacuta DSM 18095]|uniref:Transcriptional regulatory protein WalR n=1 Tax=Tissierella praeacuta DSM 18095 TaxID=1123404 RepID=A0A1M4YYA3_9FIRM|nr:response regulator YycF [Tissierella praeacuta]TCU66225.1 two-component system response regulator VicR [Tissierella praeacuta]SHF10781.1 two-component system, OmpR family, response regulator VicR [Tissierella praeacuta DSM 18095]SUP04908.1 Transcriptional regulatory protein YycF [Tissierella praeacuta]
MDNKILVIDDEKAIADIIKFNLEKEGYTVETAYDGEEGIQAVNRFIPDLVILDIMMPKKDGFQVLREIRVKYKFPVIMLTAKEEEVDKVLGLELGADDYITKPFSMRELIARVKANLRRVDFSSTSNSNNVNDMITSDDLIIDLNKYEVRKGEEIIDLTLREYELLKFLASSANQVFSREQLLEEVWGYEYYGDIRTVDVTVRRLREKIEDNSGDFKYILTKRGVGYYFRRA